MKSQFHVVSLWQTDGPTSGQQKEKSLSILFGMVSFRCGQYGHNGRSRNPKPSSHGKQVFWSMQILKKKSRDFGKLVHRKRKESETDKELYPLSNGRGPNPALLQWSRYKDFG